MTCPTYQIQVKSNAGQALSNYYEATNPANQLIVTEFSHALSSVEVYLEAMQKSGPKLENLILTASQQALFALTISALLQSGKISDLMSTCNDLVEAVPIWCKNQHQRYSNVGCLQIMQMQQSVKRVLSYHDSIGLIATETTNFYNTVAAISGLIGKNPICFADTITLSEIRLLKNLPQSLTAPTMAPIIAFLTTLSQG